MNFSYNEENQIISSITINDAISKLSKKERVVMALRVADYPYKESAEIMGITIGKYAWILRKTRKLLRSILGGTHGTAA